MAFALKEFGPVLDARGNDGKPYLLIGGQAVYFWADRYARDEPELERWRPFTSKDIDFQGGREAVISVAKILGARAYFPNKRQMTALAGVIPLTISGEKTTIEFLRSMPTVSPACAEKLAFEYNAQGCLLRVLDPISLVACKSYLALRVDQKNRRDAEHMHIMILCVRAFLRETLRGVEAGTLPARGWLGAIERVLKLAESRIGALASGKLGGDWSKALPASEIAASAHQMVVRFQQKRFSTVP